MFNPEIIREQIRDIKQSWYSFKRSRVSLIGLLIAVGIFILALFPEYVAPYPEDSSAIHMDRCFQPPSSTNIMGTDEMGRDIFSRIILGARISLTISLEVIAFALAVGVPIGLISGYLGGGIDLILMRITEIFMSIPPLLLALAICVVLPRSLENAMFAIAVTWWPTFARICRGEVMHIKQEAYVEASKSFGAGTFHITFKDILPNALTPIIVRSTLSMGSVILTLASLGFLGLGARPPTPEWGTMASTGRAYMPGKWWLTVFPGLTIILTVLCINILGDGLRDALIKE